MMHLRPRNPQRPLTASFRLAAKVQLELSSPSGHAVFTTCATTLGDFLFRTFEAVPAGSEYSWLDFDMALSELLNESAHD